MSASASAASQKQMQKWMYNPFLATLHMQMQMQTQMFSVNGTLVNLRNQFSDVADADVEADADAQCVERDTLYFL